VRRELVDRLACPSCGGDLGLAISEEAEDAEIITGSLSCVSCNSIYGIARGVPRLNEAMQGLEAVAESFSFEWKAHEAGELEKDTVFGRSLEEEWAYFEEASGFTTHSVLDIVALDAGCGPGQIARLIADNGASVVVGMDINEAVDEAFSNCRGLRGVHIVQGNVFAPPLKPKQFDLVWCNGVIHHTPDAAGAHRSLSRLVKPGGTLYVWVYAKRFNPFRFTKDVFDALHISRLPMPVLLGISKIFSYISFALLQLYRLIRTVPMFEPKDRWAERKARQRTVKELQLTWLDTLSPQYDSRHSEEEVAGWFRDVGFENILAIEEPKVGVRGVAPEEI
jgi:SAM-dependent methyltransferase/uncharacterized protein YbaR (Trm112 family)